jgi:putative transposase
VVTVFTRECLPLETDTSLGSVRVIRALEQVIGNRGEAPQRIRNYNGPQFASRCFIAWGLDRRVELKSGRATRRERARGGLSRTLARGMSQRELVP